MDPPARQSELPAPSAARSQTLLSGFPHAEWLYAGLARLVSSYGSPHSLIISTTSTFGTLARSIVSQQLSTKAAATIYARFVAACKVRHILDR